MPPYLQWLMSILQGPQNQFAGGGSLSEPDIPPISSPPPSTVGMWGGTPTPTATPTPTPPYQNTVMPGQDLSFMPGDFPQQPIAGPGYQGPVSAVSPTLFGPGGSDINAPPDITGVNIPQAEQYGNLAPAATATDQAPPPPGLGDFTPQWNFVPGQPTYDPFTGQFYDPSTGQTINPNAPIGANMPQSFFNTGVPSTPFLGGLAGPINWGLQTGISGQPGGNVGAPGEGNLYREARNPYGNIGLPASNIPYLVALAGRQMEAYGAGSGGVKPRSL